VEILFFPSPSWGCPELRAEQEMKNNGKKTTINTPGGKKKKQKDPGNRSRTSDLEISVVAIYSLPLCQLSYTRSVGLQEQPANF
jgi:hypothetical protein